MNQLIIFDWDGTLMDSALKITRCIQSAALAVGLEPPPFDTAKLVIGLGLDEAMRNLFKQSPDSQIKQLIESYKHQFVHADATEQPLFAGVEAGLQHLNEAGALVAIATGKSRVGLDRVLDQSGLRSYFAFTRCADESRTKPHPQMLLDLLDYTAIPVEKALMIGDTSFDMDMAANAQMRGLAVSYGAHPLSWLQKTSATDIVHSFEDVLNWINTSGLEPAFA